MTHFQIQKRPWILTFSTEIRNLAYLEHLFAVLLAEDTKQQGGQS